MCQLTGEAVRHEDPVNGLGVCTRAAERGRDKETDRVRYTNKQPDRETQTEADSPTERHSDSIIFLSVRSSIIHQSSISHPSSIHHPSIIHPSIIHPSSISYPSIIIIHSFIINQSFINPFPLSLSLSLSSYSCWGRPVAAAPARVPPAPAGTRIP